MVTPTSDPGSVELLGLVLPTDAAAVLGLLLVTDFLGNSAAFVADLDFAAPAAATFFCTGFFAGAVFTRWGAAAGLTGFFVPTAFFATGAAAFFTAGFAGAFATAVLAGRETATFLGAAAVFFAGTVLAALFVATGFAFDAAGFVLVAPVFAAAEPAAARAGVFTILVVFAGGSLVFAISESFL